MEHLCQVDDEGRLSASSEENIAYRNNGEPRGLAFQDARAVGFLTESLYRVIPGRGKEKQYLC